MNKLELEAIGHLVMVQRTFGAREVKSEFEAQGMELHELIRLKQIATASQMGVALKVGGAEDVWGVKQALLVGVEGIIFPMVESPYALSKSLGVVEDYIPAEKRSTVRIAVNIETNLAITNLAPILAKARRGGLDAVTLGRVDLVGSLGLGRDQINSDRIYDLARLVCREVKGEDLLMTIGGGIEAESYSFLRRLWEQKILDRIETRMVVYPSDIVANQTVYERAVQEAHRFELLWLQIMNHHYGQLVTQNEKRLRMLAARVG